MIRAIRRPLMPVVALLGAAALAGCSSSSDEYTPPPAANPTPAPTNSTQLDSPGATSVTTIGEVFARSADGLTLYTFENDRSDTDGDGPGDSDCNAGCADNWPPLLADAASIASGKYSIITRDDGSSLQWAFKGLPLYTFAGDANSGDINGDGSGDAWYVARPDPWQLSTVDASAKGEIFVGRGTVSNVDGNGGRASDRTDRDGFSLYTFENDRNDANGDGTGDSDCNAGCAETWPPLYADAGATEAGPFTIVSRDDETRQWALNGLPLYFYAPDQAPGDTDGEGAGNVWYVARPAPIADAPSTLGQILVGSTAPPAVDASGNKSAERADLAGFSLYVFDNDASDAQGDGAGDSDCNGNCAVTWPPLFADAAATPSAPFSLVTRDDGSQQWAVNGEPLYFFINDLAPGDVNGDEVGGVWHLARTAPVQVVTDSVLGQVFEARGVIADVDGNGARAASSSDKTGFTVYRFDDDRNDAEGDGSRDSDCNGGCAVTWPPLYATDGDVPNGDFTIIDREDGSRQWAYLGDPLYFFSGDGSATDINGVYGAWFTVTPDSTQSGSDDQGY